MSTKASVTFIERDGSNDRIIQSFYVHWDGYPTGIAGELDSMINQFIGYCNEYQKRLYKESYRTNQKKLLGDYFPISCHEAERVLSQEVMHYTDYRYVINDSPEGHHITVYNNDKQIYFGKLNDFITETVED